MRNAQPHQSPIDTAMRIRIILEIILFAALVLFTTTASAIEAKVAVAANFMTTMEKLQSAFEAETSHTLLISYGSSGGLFAQIRNGAPFDIFMSADPERPKKLEDEHLAVAGSRFTYAIGILVLWSPKINYLGDKGSTLLEKRFRRLAIANPDTAPYGTAGKQALIGLKLWDTIRPLLVQGTDVGQAYQFAASGNADLALVAYSQVLRDGKITGDCWIIPDHLYNPIRQDAALLERGKNNPAAEEFLRFLKSSMAVDIIRAQGYKAK